MIGIGIGISFISQSGASGPQGAIWLEDSGSWFVSDEGGTPDGYATESAGDIFIDDAALSGLLTTINANRVYVEV